LTNRVPYANLVYIDEVNVNMLSVALRKLCYYTRFAFTWRIRCAWRDQH